MKIIWYGIPIVFLSSWLWVMITGIDEMVLKEKNNKFHAMLLGCTYLGPVPDIDHVLYFDCSDNIELHKEIDWVNFSSYI